MLYLYAIVGAAPSLGGQKGIFGEPLFALSSQELYAIVGEAPGAPEKTRDRLVAHHEVVLRLAERQAAVPAKFGQLAEEHAVTADLAAKGPQLREALALVEGCVQMTLRVGVSESALETHDVEVAGETAVTLLAMPPPVEGLRRALSGSVRAEKVKVFERGEPFASLYHLVPRSLMDDWCKALEKERARSGTKIAATGPWPAYAFTPALG